MTSTTERIIAFNQGRLQPMLPIKYRFMQENAFRFYRGTCHLFYEDLAQCSDFPTGPAAWICGDLHLENFGSYRSDNDLVYFDLNDFDESILAPVTWELARLITSIYIGFDSLKIESRRAKKMAKLYLRSYVSTLLTGKANYIEAATASGIVADFLTSVAKRKQRMVLQKRTVLTKKKVQMMTSNPKHYKLDRKTRKELCEHVDTWLKSDDDSPYNYQVADAIFRVAGTGSVGVERYAFLLKSSNRAGFKYILLDMKEAVPSALANYVNIPQPQWKSEADRVIAVQRRMQNRFPALLSTSEFRGKSFIMQEMQPVKDSISFKLLKDRYRDMYSVVDTIAILTASSHLRSSGQDGSAITDELKAFGADDSWQDRLLDYAAVYATKVEAYYQDFVNDCENHGITQEAEKIEETGKIAV